MPRMANVEMLGIGMGMGIELRLTKALAQARRISPMSSLVFYRTEQIARCP
jgi:hypothetical protein